MAITNVLQAGGAFDYYESEGCLPFFGGSGCRDSKGKEGL